MAEAEVVVEGGAVEDGAEAPPAGPVEMTEEERKKEEMKRAMLTMAADAAKAAADAAKKRRKGGKKKKKKTSWDLLPPLKRQTRFWKEQFERDMQDLETEDAKLQVIIARKSEENRVAKEQWEETVRKSLKNLYQLDAKLLQAEVDGVQAKIDMKNRVAAKKSKLDQYWADALALDPYQELVVDKSIGHTLSFIILAQIAQPWGQLTTKLDEAEASLKSLTEYRDVNQFEDLEVIQTLEAECAAKDKWLNDTQDYLEAKLDKIKRRGLKHIAASTDRAKHRSAKTALLLLSPGDQEEIKNNAWFKSERGTYGLDRDFCEAEIENLEEQNLEYISDLLQDDVRRLEEEVKGLKEEVGSLKEDVGSVDYEDYEAEFSSLGEGVGELEDEDEAMKVYHSGWDGSLELEKSWSLGNLAEERRTEDYAEDCASNHSPDPEGSKNRNLRKGGAKTGPDVKGCDPTRPACALDYDVPVRLARLGQKMMERCKANTTNIRCTEYVVKGESKALNATDGTKPEAGRLSATSSQNEYGTKQKKWPVSAKLMNMCLPDSDPRKKPPKDEAPRNFKLANGRKPWDPSLF